MLSAVATLSVHTVNAAQNAQPLFKQGSVATESPCVVWVRHTVLKVSGNVRETIALSKLSAVKVQLLTWFPVQVYSAESIRHGRNDLERLYEVQQARDNRRQEPVLRDE